MSSDHRPHLEIVSLEGDATDAERAIVEEALLLAVSEERKATRPSVWRRAGRSQGRRLGMYDYRDRFNHEDAWRLSVRFPSGGREYQGRLGRGDTR